jgi:hypothetical protein
MPDLFLWLFLGTNQVVVLVKQEIGLVLDSYLYSLCEEEPM